MLSTAEDALQRLGWFYREAKTTRDIAREKMREYKGALRVAKKALKKQTPIEIKNVTRGTYIRMVDKADLKRDDRYVLMFFEDVWRMVTWVAKTTDDYYIVQVLPLQAHEKYTSVYAQLAAHPPTSREWYIVKDLSIPHNCENVVLSSETAESAMNLYMVYDPKKKTPRTKHVKNLKKYRK